MVCFDMSQCRKDYDYFLINYMGMHGRMINGSLSPFVKKSIDVLESWQIYSWKHVLAVSHIPVSPKFCKFSRSRKAFYFERTLQYNEIYYWINGINTPCNNLPICTEWFIFSDAMQLSLRSKHCASLPTKLWLMSA